MKIWSLCREVWSARLEPCESPAGTLVLAGEAPHFAPCNRRPSVARFIVQTTARTMS
jgi:hypothetical protein